MRRVEKKVVAVSLHWIGGQRRKGRKASTQSVCVCVPLLSFLGRRLTRADDDSLPLSLSLLSCILPARPFQMVYINVGLNRVREHFVSVVGYL